MHKNARITLGAAAVGLVAMASGPLVAAQAVDSLDVPAGNELNFVAHVSTAFQHTQTYTCTDQGTWGASSVPEATLVDDQGTPIVHHFLSTSPAGSAQPTWQDLEDHSRAWGTKRFGQSSPKGDANAIQWLKLEVTSSAPGRSGNNISQTTWIQRKNTDGGVKPTGSCTPKQTKPVNYTADYFFYNSSTANAS